MGHDGGDQCRCCSSELILQARCQWRLALGEVEIRAGWISFAGDRRCLYSVRWRSALFGLSERKRMVGAERKREPCVWVLRESDEKKKKKKGEKGMYTRVWCLGSGSGIGLTKSRNI